jgi:hypothetical protein
MKNLKLFEEFNSRETTTPIPLFPAKIAEFDRIVKSSIFDRSGNGAKNEKALTDAENFAIQNRNTMFTGGDWKKPIGCSEANKDCVTKVQTLIKEIQSDLDGIGSPIGGLSEDMLLKLNNLTSISLETNPEVKRYNQILNICMLFEGYRAITKKMLVSEIAEDIKADFGERHNSWYDAADAIFHYIKLDVKDA